MFDIHWRLACPDRSTHEILERCFRNLRAGPTPHSVEPIEIVREDRGGLVLQRGDTRIPLADAYELVYYVEKTITVDSQRLRPDLFFLHAAAVELDGAALLLIAPSGAGKSTTTWALVNRGFGYLSDELAPLNLRTMSAIPYPHALCLKRRPPAPFELPERTLATSRTFHLPVEDVAHLPRGPVPLGVIVFNRFDPTSTAPSLRRVDPGEASTHLYRNGLNQLAHANAGLAAAARLASELPCYALETNDLEATCVLLGEVLGRESFRRRSQRNTG